MKKLLNRVVVIVKIKILYMIRQIIKISIITLLIYWDQFAQNYFFMDVLLLKEMD